MRKFTILIQVLLLSFFSKDSYAKDQCCSLTKDKTKVGNTSGTYTDKRNYYKLTMKDDNTFLLIDHQSRKFTIGNWELENKYTLKLTSKSPTAISDFLTEYQVILDTSYILKIKKGSVLYKRKLLKKNSDQ